MNAPDGVAVAGDLLDERGFGERYRHGERGQPRREQPGHHRYGLGIPADDGRRH